MAQQFAALFPKPAWAQVLALADLMGCLVVGIAALWGTARLPALAVLLALALLRCRTLLASRVALTALAWGGGWMLRHSGNWYAAHAVFDWLVVCTAAASTLLAWPGGFRKWFSARGKGFIAVCGVGLPAATLYLSANPTIATGDTQPLLPTVVQMLQHGTRDLQSWTLDGRWQRYTFAGNPYFLRALPGRTGLYSAYPAGMEIFACPSVLIAAMLGQDLRNPQVLLRIERITAALLAAAALVLFFLLAVHFTQPFTAWTATALLALGSTFTSTHALALWQQSGVVFWILVVLLCEAHGRRGWLAAFACAAMLACRPTAVTFLIPFGAWIAWHNFREALKLSACAAVCYSPWALMYTWLYGSPFGPSMAYLNEPWQPAAQLSSVLYSPARGLLVYQPWLILLALPSARHPWRGMIAAVITLHLALVASWPMWWGGHCWGSRLVAEIVPLGALLLLVPLERLLAQPAGGWVVGAFVLIGMALHLPGSHGSAMRWNFQPTSIDAAPARLHDWRHPPFLHELGP